MKRSAVLKLLAVFFLLSPVFGCGNNDASNQSDQSAQADPAAADQGEDTAATGEDGQAVSAVADAGPANGPGAAVSEQAPPARPGFGAGGPPPGPGAGAPLPPHMATRTVGAGVRGDVGLFYDALGRQGSWVKHPDYSYVWIPAHMGPGWRPYQEGHWVWTDDYGWYWESEEPFAWAVYHYGRWDYDSDYGWFWVPGDTWAPAWVTWRFGRNTVGWAPIAPDRPGYASGAPQRFAPPILESWVFVDPHNFGDDDLGPHVLPVSHIGASLEVATDVRTPRFENGRMFNAVIQRDDMQRLGAARIETRQLVYVGNQGDMFEDVSGARVGIYRPTIAVQVRSTPPAVIEIGRADRVVVREYVVPSAKIAVDVPSAALLDVLQPNEREGLLKVRLTGQQAAMDKQVEQLRAQRSALIQQKQQQAAKMQAQLEQERQAAILQRAKDQQQIRNLRRQVAAEVKVDNSPPAAEAAASAEPAESDNSPPSGTAGPGGAPAAAMPPAQAAPEAAVGSAAPAADMQKGKHKGAHQPGGAPGTTAEPARGAPAAIEPAEQEAEAPAAGAANTDKADRGATKLKTSPKTEASGEAASPQPGSTSQQTGKGGKHGNPGTNASAQPDAMPGQGKRSGSSPSAAKPTMPGGETASTTPDQTVSPGPDAPHAKKGGHAPNPATAKGNATQAPASAGNSAGASKPPAHAQEQEKVSSGDPKAKPKAQPATPAGQNGAPPAAEGQQPAPAGADAD